MKTAIPALILKQLITTSKKMGKDRFFFLDGKNVGVTDYDSFLSFPHASEAVGLFTVYGLDLKSKPPTITVDVESPAEGYPVLPASTSTTISIDAQVLHAAISAVYPCISRDESRMTLNALYFEFTNGLLTLTATDGHRLAVRRMATGAAGMPSFLIARKDIDILLLLLKKEKGKVCLSMPDKDCKGIERVFFQAPACQLAARCVDGQFPNIEQLNIYRQMPGSVEVNRVALLNAAQSAQALVINAPLKIYGLTVTVNSKISLTGAAETPSDVPGIKTGAEGKFTLNRDYLIDALESMPDETITMNYDGVLDMVTFCGADNAINAIMPLRA